MELYTIRGSDGVEYGPCNIEQVQELVKQGRVKATTMVYTQSAKRWHLAASVNEVRALLRKHSPNASSALNRIRGIGTGAPRDSAHVMMGRISTIRVKRPFWKRIFGRGP